MGMMAKESDAQLDVLVEEVTESRFLSVSPSSLPDCFPPGGLCSPLRHKWVVSAAAREHKPLPGFSTYPSMKLVPPGSSRLSSTKSTGLVVLQTS